MRLVIALSLVLSVLSFGYPPVPDVKMTPGGICNEQDRDFKGYRHRGKQHPKGVPVCDRNVSSRTKTEVYVAYGIPHNERGEYTIDHFYPLSMGGNNAKSNLWPEHKKVKATRPQLEQDLFDDMTDGRIDQKEAFAIIDNEKRDLD